MKNVLKRSISLFLATAIVFGSAYAGFEEIDFGKTSAFLKNLVPDFSVKSQAASEVNSGTCGNNLTWTLDDEGNLIISGTGDMANYSSSASSVPWYSSRSNIKSVFIDEGVTSIGAFAFRGCKNLTTITMPEGLTSIGSRAFDVCSRLASVAIPDGVTSIGNYTFNECTSLASVTIPDSVTKIGDLAFKNCINLTSINVDGNNTSFLSIDGVLFDKAKTVLIQYPARKTDTSYVIPDGVTGISSYAFYSCTCLEAVTLLGGLVSIGEYAFYNCKSLKAVKIPDSMEYVGDYAFANCLKLMNVELNTPNIKWGINVFLDTYVYDSIIENWTSEGFAINDILIEADTERYSKVLFNSLVQNHLEPVYDNIPETTDEKELALLTECVEKVTAGLETDYEKIRAISKYICENVNYVYSLAGILSPSDVLEKGAAACGGFAELTRELLTIAGIPCRYVLGGAHAYNMAYDSDNQRWLYIDNAFARCTTENTGFNESFFDFSIDLLGTLNHEVYTDFDFVIDNITYTLVLPTAPDKLWLNTDNWYWEVKEVPVETEEFTIPDNIKGISVKSIGEGAFRDCTKITTVTIPDSVTTIGKNAFNGCTSLDTVTIPDSVTNLGCKAFENTAYYNDSANWENDVLYIGDYLIKAKDTISGVCEIKAGTKRIAERSFYGCKNITSIIIPYSITSIGDYAFYYCSGIDAITIPDSVTSVGEYAFWCCSKLATVTIPDSVTSIGIYAFSNCSRLDAITIPDSVANIGYGAFSYCKKLTSITIPDSVSSIAGKTFEQCSNLISVTIPDSVSRIGDYAFYGCTSLEYVFYTGSESDWTNISVGSNNSYLTDVSINYSFTCHSWSDWYVANEATCTSAGTEKRNCSTCTYYETRHIEATGHSYNSVVTEPTCTQNGYTIHTCTHCGDVYKDSVVKAPGHISGDWIIDADVSCTKNGSKHIECMICGKVLKTEVISTTGHKQSEWIIDKEVNCSKDGLKHVECTVCGEILDTVVTTAKGHKYSDWIIDKQPTCETEGSKHKTCTVCEDVITRVIYTTEHSGSYWVTVTEVTCMTDGVAHKICTVCGETIETDVIPAIGHNLPKWVIDKKATVYAAGKKHKECTECGAVLETATIAQLKCSKPTLCSISNTTSGVKVTWGKVSGADRYRVYRKTSSSGWTCLNSKVTSTSYTDTTAKSGTTYYYTVRAENEAGLSSYNSTGISIKRLSTPKLSKAENTTSGVKITWGKVTGASGYIVYRKTSGGSWKELGKTTKTYYIDKTAKSGTTYYYTVRAYSGSVKSYYDTTGLKIKHLADPTLNTPTSTKSGVSLKWSKVTGASGYIIYRKTGSGSYTKLATVKGSTKVSYVDKSAKKGNKYTYTVKAYYSNTYSAYSNTKTITDKY